MPIRYKNQKAFRFINSEKDQYHPYSKFNNDDLVRAQQSLSNVAFRLYIYFGMFKEVKQFILSKVNVQVSTGISESSYYSAIKELEENNYIQKDCNSSEKDQYIFVENGKIV